MPGQAPEFLIENAELLLGGQYARDGFDLVITGPDGSLVVVPDYFSFNPPPNLVLANGNGLSPEMVKSLLHDRWDGVLFAGPAESPPVLEQIGVVTFASGTVKRINANGEDTLKKGDPLYEGDEIVVEGRGFMVANMNDGTRFTQGANSRTTLDNFDFDEGAKTGTFEAKVLLGGFSYRSGKIGEFAGNTRDHTKISTPSAVIRVRGSELEGNVDPNTLQTTVIHKSGFLTVTDINDSNPVILDTSNDITVVINGGVPTSTGTASPEQIAAVQQGLPPASVMEQLDQEENQNEEDGSDDSGEDGEDSPEASGDEPAAEGEEAVESETSAEEGEGENPETAEDDTEQEGDETEDDGSEEESEDQGEETGEGEEVAADAGEEPGDGSVDTGTDASAGEDGAAGQNGQSADGNQTDGDNAGSEGDSDSASDSGSTGTNNTGVTLGSDGGVTSDGGSTSRTGTTGTSGTGTSTTGTSTTTTGSDANTGNDQVAQELPPDNPPTSEDDVVTIAENETQDISALVLANDEDPDLNQSPQLASIDVTGTSGSVVLDATNQTLSYTASDDQFDSLGAGETATDTFSYTVTSGQFSSTSTVTITIEGQNDPTVAVDDDYATDGGVDLVVDAANGLLANDTDVDANDTLTVIDASVTSDDGTVINVNTDGSFEFLASGSSVLNQLASGETFTSTIVYTVQSSAGDTTTAIANIVVTGVNTPPSTTDDTASLLENATVTVQPLTNDTDVDGDTLTLTAATVSGGNGTVTITGNDLVFTPTTNIAENDTLQDTIVYTVSDGQVTSTGNIVVTITGVNDPPEISVQTPEQIPEVQATSGPTDITSSVLAVIGDDSPGTEVTALDDTNTVGSVILGSVIYDATGFFDFLNLGESFTDTFGFTATDVQGLNTDGTFSITILGEADAPVVSGPLSFTNSEDDAPLALDLLTNASDVDTTDVLSLTNIVITGNDAGINIVGTNLNLDPNAYTSLSAGDNEVINIVYDVTDTTGLTAAQTATITITGVNDAPDVVPVTLNLTEDDASTNGDFLAGASDVEGDALSIANLIVSSGLSSGVTTSGSTFTVDPSFYDSLADGESEVIVYSFDVLDGNGGSTPNTATITIAGVNDAPTTSNSALTTQEDIPLVLSPGDFSFIDPDSTDLLEEVRIDVLPALGVLELSGVAVTAGQVVTINDLNNGLLTFTPGLNENGTNYTSFSFSVGDGLAFSSSATATIDVVPVNDAPIVNTVDVPVTEGGAAIAVSLLQGASDVEGDNLNVINLTVLSGDDTGITPAGNTLSVDPGFSSYDSLALGETEVVTYSFDVVDGNGGSTPGTLTVSISGQNDAPSSANASLTTAEDIPLTISDIDFPFVDIDGSDLLEGVRIDSLPSAVLGVLQVSSVNATVGQFVSVNDLVNGALVYVPNADANDALGLATFNFSVFDGTDFSISPSVFTANVNAVNDAPVAVADAFNVTFNTPLMTTAGTDGVLENDTDVENNTLTAVLQTDVLNGTLVLNSDGSFDYTPGLGFTGVDSFVYQAFDGTDLSTPVTVTLTIVGSPGTFATVSGDFSDPTIYSGNTVPAPGEDLIVNSGVTVTLDNTTAGPVTLNSLDIDGSGGGFNLFSNTLNITQGLTMGAGSAFALENSTLSVGLSAGLDGLVDVQGGNVTIDGMTVTNNSALNIKGGVPSSTTLNLPSGIANFGTITFDNQTGLTRNLSITTPGTFDNGNGSVNVLAGDPGTKIISATTFDAGAGVVSVDSGEVLQINVTTTNVSSDSAFNGLGTVRFNGTQTIQIDGSSFNIDSVDPIYDLAGNITIAGAGSLNLGTGGVLTLTADTVDAPIFVSAAGTLRIDGGTSTISNAAYSSSGMVLIRGVSGPSSTVLLFTASVASGGTLLFDNTTNLTRNLTLDASGQTFTNSGTIQVSDSGTGGGINAINATTFGTVNGTIDIASGDILQVNATTTQIGTPTTISNSGTLQFNGTQSIDLVTDFTLLSNHDLNLNGTITIAGPGVLTIDLGALLELTSDAIDADLVINGTLTATNLSNAINGTITSTGPMSMISVLGTTASTATLDVANGFTNNGIIELDNTVGVNRTINLNILSGTLTNTATINSESSGGGGGENRISGNLTNLGVINVNADTQIGSGPETFVTSAGTINVAMGKNLDINTTTTQLGATTTLSGSMGTISLEGVQLVDVTSPFTLASTAPLVLTPGLINFGGTATFTVGSGATLTLTSDTLSAPIDNQGSIVFEGNSNAVNSTTFSNSGFLTLKGNAASTSTVTFSNAFTNGPMGTLEFDNITGVSRTLNYNFATLVNDGAITSEDTGTGGGNYNLTGDITHNGSMVINSSLNVSGLAFDATLGTIAVNGTNVLDIGSTSVTLGAGGNVTGTGTLEFSGAALTLTAPFTVSATSPVIDFTGFVVIGGGGSFDVQSGGTLTFTADQLDTNISNAGNVFIEENTTDFNGTITTVAGGKIEIQGTTTSSVQLTVANSFSNVAGAFIELDNLSGASRNVTLEATGVTITNAGTITTNNTGMAASNNFSINGSIVNTGTIDVNENVTIGGGVLDNGSGTIDIAASQRLNYSGSNLSLGSATGVTGSLGVLEVSGPLITLNGAFAYSTAQPLFDLSGFLTISGTGSLDIQSGATFTLTNDTIDVGVSVNNAGNLFADEQTVTINGAISSNTGTLAVRGNSSSTVTLTVDNGFTNNGTILVDNTVGVSRTMNFNVTNGTLTNAAGAFITTSNTGGAGANTISIDAEILNQGTLNIDEDATVFGTTFDNQTGTIDVAAGKALDLNVSTTEIGTSSVFIAGDLSSFIKFLGVQSLNLNSDFTFLSTAPVFDFAGDITIGEATPSTFTIDTGANLVLTADTIATSTFVNNGSLLIEDNANLVNSGTFTNSAGAITKIQGGTDSSTIVTFANNITNAGNITLDNPLGISRNITANFSGTLTNSNILTTDQTGAGNANHTINVTGAFVNDGTFDIVKSVQLVLGAASSNGSGGNINIFTGQTLDLDVTTFTNDGTIDIATGATLDLTDVTTFTHNGALTGSGTIENSNAISGGGSVDGAITLNPGASPGILTLDGGLNSSVRLEIELEGLEAGTGHDQLVVNGVANLGSSFMDVVLLNGYVPEVGDSYVVFTADAITGHFGQVSGLDIATDKVLDIQYVGGDVVLTAVATTQVGDASANTISGTGSQDVVVAGAGDDMISVGAGGDIVFAQAGDDTIVVDGDFTRVDGGEGVDRLVVDGLGEDDGKRVDNIEILDIEDGSATLSATTVKELTELTNDLTGVDNSLVVEGSNVSALTLVGNFQFDRTEQLDSVGGNQTYDVYLDGDASVFVLQGVLVAHQEPMESSTAGAPIDLSNVETLAAAREEAPVSEETNISFAEVFETQDPLSALLANLPSSSVYAAEDAANVSPATTADVLAGNTVTQLQDTLLPLDQVSDI